MVCRGSYLIIESFWCLRIPNKWFQTRGLHAKLYIFVIFECSIIIEFPGGMRHDIPKCFVIELDRQKNMDSELSMDSFVKITFILVVNAGSFSE